MKNLLIALVFLCVSAPAIAQNPQCPTRPLGDSTNACASTAFVQNSSASEPTGVPIFCDGTTNQTVYVQSKLSTGNAFIPPSTTCLVTAVSIPTNGTLKISANSSLKKFGSSNVVLLAAAGADVTLLGPGSVDMNSDPIGNVTFTGNTRTLVDGIHFKNGTLHDVYFQDVSGWTVKNSFFTNNAYFANIINYALGADEFDINILNNYCDRTGVPNPLPAGAGQCFYFVPQGHSFSRVRVSDNTCIGPGVAQINTTESSCLIFLAEGDGTTIWQFPEAIVSGNITRNFNFPYSLGGIINGSVTNNTATGAGPEGYCYEIGGNKDTVWGNNSCDGNFTTGAPFILNNSTGVSVVGGTITHRATGAGAIAFQAISSGTGTGKNNVIQGITFNLSGGVGLFLSGDNYVVSGNFFNGNTAAVNAINLNTGNNRTVNGNNAVGFTGAALINPGATDSICGNNFYGCTTLAVTVANLPTCNAAVNSTRMFVTNSNATLTAGIGAVVAGGGANNVPVVCDGTNWRIG